jgi:uncharacterized protein (DUF2062 family)
MPSLTKEKANAPSWWTRQFRRISALYHRLVSLRDDPRKVALGFALGLFVGMSPYMMFHTITALFLASLLKWNRLSAAVGVFITNPVTAPVVYQMTYLAGKQVIPTSGVDPIPESFSLTAVMDIFKGAPELLWVLTVGGIFTGIPIAIIGYGIAFWGICRYRRKHNPGAKRSGAQGL